MNVARAAIRPSPTALSWLPGALLPGLIASVVLMPLHAQVPTDQFAKPPANATVFTILSTSGTNGKSYQWVDADGTHMSRESLLLRGQVWEVDQRVVLGADHMPSSWIVRGVTPNGDAGETFSIDDKQAKWKSPIDKGEAEYQAPAFYSPMGGTSADGTALFLEALLAAPGKSLPMLPGGRAHAEKLTELAVGQGDKKKTVTAWAITGVGPSPFPIWATAEGVFFGYVGGLGVLPAGYEDALKPMMKAQDEALAARSPALLKQLLKSPDGPVAFQHVRAFLDGTHFADDQTVIVTNGTISAVGPAESTTLPDHAKVFDGAGKTLVPGLWDAHQHIGDDFTGPFLLSLGITSARDPGNDNDLTMARAKRRASGELLAPHVYPSVLIDGKAPTARNSA